MLIYKLLTEGYKHCEQQTQKGQKKKPTTTKHCMWRMVKQNKICRKAETAGHWRSAKLWRACLDFSTPENTLSDSGSVALTPISAYTFTVACATVMREQTMCLGERTTHSERKYAIVRKCNPLTASECPLEKHLAVLLERRFRHCALQRCPPSSLQWLHGKQMCSKGKPLFTFCRRNEEGMTHCSSFFYFMALPCFVSHSTFHLSWRCSSHPVPVFHCNQGQLLFQMQQSPAAHYIHKGLQSVHTESESVAMWYLIIYYHNPTYSYLH